MLSGLQHGSVIAGRYRLNRLLGRGGMGVVWEATHLVTQRVAALKLLHGPLNTRPDMRRRLLREARAASTVVHPNVVEVLDLFELEDGTPVLVMTLLRGETLGSKLQRDGSLSLEATCELMLPVISAVGTAHALGVVHRDLKPENIFLAELNGARHVKVLDFGIAKLSGSDDGEALPLTVTGATLGTPCYMAPEQGFGEPDVDHRADIWSLGAILYECLSGGRPVEGDSLGQVLKRFMTQGITPLEVVVPDLPSPVAALITSMLSRDARNRPSDLREPHRLLGGKEANFGAPLPPRSSSSLALQLETEIAPPLKGAPAAEPELDAPGSHSLSIVTQFKSPRARRVAWLGVAAGVAVMALSFSSWRSLQPRSVEPPVAVSLDRALPKPVAPTAAPASELADSALPAAPAAAAPPAIVAANPPRAIGKVARWSPSPLPPNTARPLEAEKRAPKTEGLYEEPPF